MGLNMEEENLLVLDNVPNKVERSYPHYQQTSNWDCGISCVIMALKDKDRKWLLQNDNLLKFCAQEGFAQSTWTIDLCYFLKRLGISFLYATITIGVDPSYSKEAYYNQILQKDTERVARRFKDASINGIQIQQRSVALSEILAHLANSGPIIVLINANSLLSSAEYAKIYQGHYILVVGYDLSRRSIIYHDPNFRQKKCHTSFDKFEASRNSYGTDMDIIFIFSKDSQEKNSHLSMLKS